MQILERGVVEDSAGGKNERVRDQRKIVDGHDWRPYGQNVGKNEEKDERLKDMESLDTEDLLTGTELMMIMIMHAEMKRRRAEDRKKWRV